MVVKKWHRIVWHYSKPKVGTDTRPTYPAGKLNFSKTKRASVGSRKPKHELSGVMMQDIKVMLGKVMSFQHKCFPVV